MMELVITCWSCKGEIRGEYRKAGSLAIRAMKLGWELRGRDPTNNPCSAEVCICPGCCEENAEVAKIQAENIAYASAKESQR